MTPDRLRQRIAARFAGDSERADVWRLFETALATDAFLNLGYSPWYLPHVLGSPQRRLAAEAGRRLAARIPRTEGVRLLDVGAGRGGPAIALVEQFGFDVVGVDLVRANVQRARENAAARGVDAAVVVGDATQLPVRPGSMGACTALDALVYVPDRAAAFDQVAAALEPGGVLVVTDLFVASDYADEAHRAVARFADAWDMPVPATRGDYEDALAVAGFDVCASVDVSAHSVGRFRRWTTLALWLARGPLGGAVDALLDRGGLDAQTVREQVRLAHEALPWLRHGVVVARQQASPVAGRS